MKKTYLLLLIAFVCFWTSSVSQTEMSDFERFKKEQERKMQEQKDDFLNYKEKRDHEFVEFLKQEWENFKLFSSGEPISFPGPETVPVYIEDEEKEDKVIPANRVPRSKISILPVEERPIRRLSPSAEIIPKLPEIREDYVDEADIDIKVKVHPKIETLFYGTDISLQYPENLKDIKLSDINEEGIAKFWGNMSQLDYYILTDNLLSTKNNLILNDFAYLKLVEHVSGEFFNDDSRSKLLSWFLLIKSGYNVRIGYSGNNVYLMVPVQNQVYGYPFYTFEGQSYYVFDKNVSSIKTYKENYSQNLKIMDFNLVHSPLFAENIGTANLSFTFEGRDYDFDIDYNLNHIEFYEDYPQADIRVFFNADMSSTAKNSLIQNFDSLLYKMDEYTAVSFLLRMTQTAFDYKTDDEQFGREKYFFPEELLHYPYSDCEDRSVFFAYLVKEFLHLPVIGLNYPGHIATAINFNEDISGTYFNIDGNDYIVCDPTYINAPIGLQMPDFENAEVRILGLKNNSVKNQNYVNIWSEVINIGGNRFLNTNDIVQVDEKYFISGYFEDNIEINNVKYQAEGDRSIFVMKIDHDGSILNYSILNSFGKSFIYNIESIGANIYLTGYFSGKIGRGNDYYENEGDKKFFAALFDNRLNLRNFFSAKLVDNYSQNQYFFQIVIDDNFKKSEYNSISEQSFNLIPGVAKLDNGFISFTGWIDDKSFNIRHQEILSSIADYDVSETLAKLYSSLSEAGSSKYSTGLFALLSLLKAEEISITGAELIETIQSINPKLITEGSDFKSSLESIKSISSKNDIIRVSIIEGDAVNFGNINVEDKGYFRVSNISNDDLRIIPLSNIYYKPFLRNYGVNNISLSKQNNDMELEYNHNRSVIVVNIENDLIK